MPEIPQWERPTKGFVDILKWIFENHPTNYPSEMDKKPVSQIPSYFTRIKDNSAFAVPAAAPDSDSSSSSSSALVPAPAADAASDYAPSEDSGSWLNNIFTNPIWSTSPDVEELTKNHWAFRRDNMWDQESSSPKPQPQPQLQLQLQLQPQPQPQLQLQPQPPVPIHVNVVTNERFKNHLTVLYIFLGMLAILMLFGVCFTAMRRKTLKRLEALSQQKDARDRDVEKAYID